MKVSPVSLMAAALSASFAPPVREDQATRVARMTGQSPEDVRASLDRMGFTSEVAKDAFPLAWHPPRKADLAKKKERKSARDARKRNRK